MLGGVEHHPEALCFLYSRHGEKHKNMVNNQ